MPSDHRFFRRISTAILIGIFIFAEPVYFFYAFGSLARYFTGNKTGFNLSSFLFPASATFMLVLLNYVFYDIYRTIWGRRPVSPRVPLATTKSPKSLSVFILFWVVAILGIVIFAVYGNFSAYYYTLVAHRMIGVFLFFVFFAYVRRTLKPLGSRKVSFFYLFYPVFYLWSYLAPTPLSIAMIINVFILGGYLLHILLDRTDRSERGTWVAWWLFYYAVSLTIISIFYAILSPTTVRFVSYWRHFHAFVALPMTVVAGWAMYRFRTASTRPVLSYWREVATVMIICLVATGFNIALLRMKGGELEQFAASTTYPTKTLADVEKKPFRILHDINRVNGSDDCRKCHDISFAQWEYSTHAFALKNEAFQNVLKQIIRSKGLEFSRECIECHEPALALTDRLDLATDPTYLKRSEGVSCKACHYMSASKGFNALYALSLPRIEVQVRPGAPYREKPKGAFASLYWGIVGLMTDGETNKTTLPSVFVLEHLKNVNRDDLARGGQMCFPCHSLKSRRNGHDLIPYDNVLSFLSSGYANKLACQDCHMPRSIKDERSYSWKDHTFLGDNWPLGDFKVPGTVSADAPKITVYNTDDEEAVMPVGLADFVRRSKEYIAGLLKIGDLSETFNDAAVKSYRIVNPFFELRRLTEVKRVVSGGEHFSIDLARSSMCTTSRPKLDISFTVVNRSIGHDFPSALFANISKTWFELSVWDRSGKLVAHRSLDEYDLSNQLGRFEAFDNGTHIEPVDNPRYTTIINNNKFLEPQKPFEQSFDLDLPNNYRWPFHVRIELMTLRYAPKYTRSFSGGAIDHIPPTSLASWEGMIYPARYGDCGVAP